MAQAVTQPDPSPPRAAHRLGAAQDSPATAASPPSPEPDTRGSGTPPPPHKLPKPSQSRAGLRRPTATVSPLPEPEPARVLPYKAPEPHCRCCRREPRLRPPLASRNGCVRLRSLTAAASHHCVPPPHCHARLQSPAAATTGSHRHHRKLLPQAATRCKVPEPCCHCRHRCREPPQV